MLLANTVLLQHSAAPTTTNLALLPATHNCKYTLNNQNIISINLSFDEFPFAVRYILITSYICLLSPGMFCVELSGLCGDTLCHPQCHVDHKNGNQQRGNEP